MGSDALVALLTWNRLVPWKVLSLPRRVTDDFVPLAYGSKSTVFRGRARKGSTLWVVTRPIPERLHPPSLVAKVAVEGLYTIKDLPAHYRTRGIESLMKKWTWVAISNPKQSEFYELNDARLALQTLQIKSFSVMRSFPGGAKNVQDAFASCRKQTRARTVFLSYTHAESARFALALAGGLREEGFSPWLDSLTLPRYEMSREPGPTPERLSMLIRIGLHRSRLAIVVGTSNYGSTPWTRREREWIRRRRRETGELRCVEISRGAYRMPSCDRSFPDAPPRELARKIAVWWKREGIKP